MYTWRATEENSSSGVVGGCLIIQMRANWVEQAHLKSTCKSLRHFKIGMALGCIAFVLFQVMSYLAKMWPKTIPISKPKSRTLKKVFLLALANKYSTNWKALWKWQKFDRKFGDKNAFLLKKSVGHSRRNKRHMYETR